MDNKPQNPEHLADLVQAGVNSCVKRYQQLKKTNPTSISTRAGPGELQRPEVFRLFRDRRPLILHWYHVLYKESYAADPKISNQHFPEPLLLLEDYKRNFHEIFPNTSSRQALVKERLTKSFYQCAWDWLWSYNKPEGEENQRCDLWLIFKLYPSNNEPVTTDNIDRLFDTLIEDYAPLVYFLRAQLVPTAWQDSSMPEFLALLK